MKDARWFFEVPNWLIEQSLKTRMRHYVGDLSKLDDFTESLSVSDET